MVSLRKGTPAYELLLRKEKEQAERKKDKYAKGEGEFQLSAIRDLKEQKIECDNPTMAQSILQKDKHAKGEGEFQLSAMRDLKEQKIECDDPTMAQSILLNDKYAKGEGNFQLSAMTDLKKRKTTCDDPTKAKSKLEKDKYAKGEGNFQLSAMRVLKERNIECDDPTKAWSILLASSLNPMKNPEIAAKNAAAHMGARNPRFKGDKWSPDEVNQLRKLCKAQYNITKITEIMNCDVASKRTVHHKIFELQIRVNF